MALAELRRLPEVGTLQLMAQHERRSLLQPPRWLRHAQMLHLAHHEAAQQGITAAHLIDAMEKLGAWCSGWTQTDELGNDNPVCWYGDSPVEHLKRVGTHALAALGISEGLMVTALPSPPGAHQHSTHLALRWLGQAAQRLTQHPPPDTPWGLPDSVERVVGLRDAEVRVLLKAGVGAGALGQLRLRPVYERGAHLRLAPMPTSLCLLIDAEFGQALETVTHYLRHTLLPPGAGSALPPLADIALAWDLAPAVGNNTITGIGSLHGSSAGAAFACAALLALAPYAPPALRSQLQHAATLLPQALITAAVDEHGGLHPVGGISAKAQGFIPLAQALARWAEQAANPQDISTLYLARQQTVPELDPAIQPELLNSVTDILQHLARRAAPLSEDQERFLSEGFADPVSLSQVLTDAVRRDQTEALLNRLVDDPIKNPVRSVQQAALQGVARWVRQAGGRLRHQFVPVRVQPESTEAKRLPAAALEPFHQLPELLHLVDDSAHRSYLLKGLPGAGKSVLLRRHMLECCERMLQPESAIGDTTPTVELPIYLPMDAFDRPDPPANTPRAPWWAEQARQFTRDTLARQGWSYALVNALLQPGSTELPPVRLLLDALNELPMPENAKYPRRERARWVVQGFQDAFSPRSRKPLLSVRSEHFDVPDSLPVEVMPWTPAHIEEYLTRFFGPDRAAGLWPDFARDKVLLDLCSRPMHLHMQCELIEHGYAPLATDRASLYLAHLWLRLRRGLGLFGQRDTRQQPDKALSNDLELLTQRDRAQIEQTKPGLIDADDLRDLPTEGWLLRGLIQQAEHQYWQEAEVGKDSHERCSVSVRIKDIRLRHSNGDEINTDLKERWLDACTALDLLEKDGANRVKFSHQSWGEFFASLRLLDTPPDELERQVKAGVPGTQEKWDRAVWRPFKHLHEPVSAEAERQALRGRVNRRWVPALPMLKALIQKDEGLLSVSMDEFKVGVNMSQASDAAVEQYFESLGYVSESVLRFDAATRRVWASLDRWATASRVPGEVDLAQGRPWAVEGSAWQVLVVHRLFHCFEHLVWQHLRQGDDEAPGLTEEAVQQLQEEPGHIHLPATSDVQEVFNLALQGLPQARAEAWLSAWLAHLPHPQAWRVLAPAALALRQRLEPPEVGRSGVTALGCWAQPAPLLQHLRRWLLLASIDAGPTAKPRTQAAQLLPALDAPIPGLPAAIETAWQAQRQAAFAAPGLDLLLRLQAGQWLGELGDNLRYEQVSRAVEGRERAGIRLKAAHWVHVPASGPNATHRIGSPRFADSQPVWTVPDDQFPTLRLPEARFAHSPAVVMQWQAFVDDLRAQGLDAPELWAEGQTRWNNPLQPITSLTWFQAQAFTAWAAPLHAGLFPELNGPNEPAHLALPTEVQHEAAVRFDPAHPHPESSAAWPLDPGDNREPGQMPLDLFNHNRTRWGAPAPVGVFSAAFTPTGIEAMGNVCTWCSNAFTANYVETHRPIVLQALTAQDVRTRLDLGQTVTLSLRGGSLNVVADGALAACRNHLQPDLDFNDVGLRWQMSRPIFGP